MKLENLKELFVDEIEDIYDAEQQLLLALPVMAETATTEELRQSFKAHLQQTQGHVHRLEQIFELLGQEPETKKCKAMQGLIAEGKDGIKHNKATPEVTDAGLISAAQRVEHYEIAAYTSARTYAQHLGNDQAAKLLEMTLTEEEQANQKLAKLAIQVINLKDDAHAVHAHRA